MRSKQMGFTIVELLIVIVVIGILAAITIVAYTGIQQRAQNTQTISAVAQWAKIIRMFEADTGSLPIYTSCLGSNLQYGPTATDISGYQCRQDTAVQGIVIGATFTTLMQKYSPGAAQPAQNTTAFLSATNWYRGAYYYASSVPPRIDYVLAGANTQCPDIGGLKQISRYVTGDAIRCITNF